MTGHPEIDAILDRAQHYRHEVYRRDGLPPETFLVTEQEYFLLQHWREPSWVAVNVDTLSCIDPHPLYLFGMRVVQPERMAWDRDDRWMEHLKVRLMPAVWVGDPIPLMCDIAAERCRTALPSRPQREVTCPCGEVIWDLSMCTAWVGLQHQRDIDAALQRAMFDRVEQNIAAAFHSSGSIGLEPSAHARATDPLPPLDDLDEGLQCCGQRYPTFATFLAHRRGHQEMR
jgi:hypothetical protein